MGQYFRPSGDIEQDLRYLRADRYNAAMVVPGDGKPNLDVARLDAHIRFLEAQQAADAIPLAATAQRLAEALAARPPRRRSDPLVMATAEAVTILCAAVMAEPNARVADARIEWERLEGAVAAREAAYKRRQADSQHRPEPVPTGYRLPTPAEKARARSRA